MANVCVLCAAMVLLSLVSLSAGGVGGDIPCTDIENCYDCLTDASICDECDANFGINVFDNCTECADTNCITCNVRQDYCTNCTAPYVLDGYDCVMEEEDEDCGALVNQASLGLMFVAVTGFSYLLKL